MSGQLAVTVLTGSPGNDGSRVFEQLIQQSEDVRLTAIVPKRSKKRSRSTGEVSVIPTTERLVQLGQGCSCCTVRGDLMAKIQKIADEKSADHILIHTSPHTDLRTVAKTFTVADDAGVLLSDVAHIHSLVTVVDASSFFRAIDSVGSRELFERVELANIILLEGTSNSSADEIENITAAIRALNAGARIVHSDDKGFVLSSLQSDLPFDLDLAGERAAGPNEMGSEPQSAGSVVKFSYQARRPFHPGRLHALLAEPWAGVLRGKGTFWVASRPEFACALDVAGMSRNMVPEGMWWATVSKEERPQSPYFTRYLETIWHPEFGDRHQSINIVGVAVDEDDLHARFEACLLTDEELNHPDQWTTFSDPFQWPPANR